MSVFGSWPPTAPVCMAVIRPDGSGWPQKLVRLSRPITRMFIAWVDGVLPVEIPLLVPLA